MDLLRELDGLSSGSRYDKTKDRWFVRVQGHPCADTHGYVLSSRFVVENVVGKYLPKTMVVHHVDGDPSNDKNNNLVACEDLAYHTLLHARMNALEACGHASWRKCCYCHKYDDLRNLTHNLTARNYYHSVCFNDYQRERRAKRDANT